MSRAPKTHRVGLRLTEAQWNAIKVLADAEDKTVSELVREAVDGLAMTAEATIGGLGALASSGGTKRQALEVLTRQFAQFQMQLDALRAEVEADERRAAS